MESEKPSPYSQSQLDHPRPYDMPINVFWDITDGANARRAKWIIDNLPEADRAEAAYVFALHEEDFQQSGSITGAGIEERRDEQH